MQPIAASKTLAKIPSNAPVHSQCLQVSLDFEPTLQSLVSRLIFRLVTPTQNFAKDNCSVFTEGEEHKLE